MIRAHRADGSSSRTLIGRPFILPPVPLGADPRRGRFGSNVATTRGLGHRLARSLPDARAIADELTARSVKPNLGGSVCDPTDPVGRLLSNVLTMIAECEADRARMRTRKGMKVARARGRLRGKQPTLSPKQQPHLGPCMGRGSAPPASWRSCSVSPLDGVPDARPGPLPRRRPDSRKGTAVLLWPLVCPVAGRSRSSALDRCGLWGLTGPGGGC